VGNNPRDNVFKLMQEKGYTCLYGKLQDATQGVCVLGSESVLWNKAHTAVVGFDKKTAQRRPC